MSPRFKSILDMLSTVLLILVSGSVLWRLYGPAPLPPGSRPQVEDVRNLTIDSTSLTHVRGTGAVVLVEFSDYECPFCGRHSRDTAPKIKAELIDSGAIQHVFLNFPLAIHKRAEPAAQAAECAAQQKRFWEMHDQLFEAPTSLEVDDLITKAEKVGLDKTLFAECMKAGLTEKTIRADMAEGERLGVKATPAFFVGRRQPDGSVTLVKRINGAVPFESFKDAVGQVSSTRQARGE